jgi:hypothetical protein
MKLNTSKYEYLVSNVYAIKIDGNSCSEINKNFAGSVLSDFLSANLEKNVKLHLTLTEKQANEILDYNETYHKHLPPDLSTSVDNSIEFGSEGFYMVTIYDMSITGKPNELENVLQLSIMINRKELNKFYDKNSRVLKGDFFVDAIDRHQGVVSYMITPASSVNDN